MNDKLREWNCNGCDGDLCRLIVDEGDGRPTHCAFGLSGEKYNCMWSIADTPIHETVEQWEERTGETYPDDALVWSWVEENQWWDYYPYGEAKEEIERHPDVKHIHIVSTPHGKPEEK